MRARKVERKRTDIGGQCCSVQGRVFDVVLSDLTQGGCRFRDPQRILAIASPVNMTIDGTGPHRAHVRWREQEEVGVSFIRPLTAEQVEALISGKPSKTVHPISKPRELAPPNRTASSLPLRRIC
ncbi:PilZ domain-containing protein [Altererythrobacter sp.]|uniref:PilZ domain-containing protein n=1 Tax=Altererythrobacter sp. TaxID=1872480 RepID=UPI003CFF6813